MLGVLCIGLFFMSFYFTYSDRNIRVNGTLIKAPIVEFYGRISRPNGGCCVLINGMKINAGKIDNLNYSLGDSILVPIGALRMVTITPLHVVPIQRYLQSPNNEFMNYMREVTGLTGAALIVYMIISEGTRIVPLRNAIPLP